MITEDDKKNINSAYTLPPTSFVAVQCSESMEATRIWESDDSRKLPWEGLPLVVSFADNTDKKSDFVNLYADRYGGLGVGVNGGAGRCAGIYGVQVKGCGATPLVGLNPDRFHSDGFCALRNVVREAIWSEVLGQVLPFGAPKVISVFQCRGTLEIITALGVIRVPQGALIRDFFLRPAHFMRAALFNTTDSVETSDTVRTRNAVQTLVAHQLGIDFADTSGLTASRLNEALTTLLEGVVHKIAHQMGVAYSKRILHGNIGCSNVGWHGEWADLDTCTTVVDFAPFNTGGFDKHPFGIEYEAVDAVIHNLTYSFLRFTSHRLDLQANLSMYLKNCLRSTYSITVKERLIRLTGLPANLATRIPTELSERFLVAVDRRLNKMSAPFYYTEGSIWPMPKTIHPYALCEDLKSAQLRLLQKYSATESVPLEAAKAAPSDLDGILESIYSSVGLLPDTNSRSSFHATLLNSVRINLPTPVLYRCSLDQMIDAKIENEHDLGAVVETTIARAKLTLLDIDRDEFSLTALGTEFRLSVSNGSVIDGEKVTPRVFFEKLYSHVNYKSS